MLTDAEKRAVLRWYPFEGDKDDSGVVHLRSVVVIARKAGHCFTPCADGVKPRQQVLAWTGVLDGEAKTLRFCEPCCKAIARQDEDCGEEIEQRMAEFFRRAGHAD